MERFPWAWKRHPKNPILPAVPGTWMESQTANPDIALYDGVYHLYFWKDRPGGGFDIHHAVSEDGFSFREPSPAPCLLAGPAGSWESHSVETPRIFREGGLYYMVYCGSDRFDDYPSHAGLAVSRDLVRWEKYAGNPIFERGKDGSWDEGAVWFPTVKKINGRYWMWYEGYGGGASRDEAYGTYLTEARSQIGLATLDAPYFYVKP